MATLVLGAAGAALGGSIGGSILGVSATTIGGMIGSSVGAVVDSWIVSSLAPGQRFDRPRLDSLRITSSTEGTVIPRLYGRMRIGGNIIWATDFREETRTTRQGGGKGGGPSVRTTEYLYYASFAVALCEGPITGIGRVWVDGKPMDLEGVTWRWYPGDEAQQTDPFIAAKMGAESTPAYRGTAYVVFEELPLERYGNRLPQVSFEVFRPLADSDTAEGLTRAVTLIPASGEFTYRIGLFVDIAEQPGTASGRLAVRSADVHYGRIPSFVKAYFTLKKLDEFSETLIRTGKLHRPKGEELGVGDVLQLLEPLHKDERAKFFGARVYALVQDSAGSTGTDLDPELKAVLDFELSEFDTYVEMLVAMRGNFHRQYITECIDSLLMKNRPGALIAQGRTKRAPRRFVFESRLL